MTGLVVAIVAAAYFLFPRPTVSDKTTCTYEGFIEAVCNQLIVSFPDDVQIEELNRAESIIGENGGTVVQKIIEGTVLVVQLPN